MNVEIIFMRYKVAFWCRYGLYLLLWMTIVLLPNDVIAFHPLLPYHSQSLPKNEMLTTTGTVGTLERGKQFLLLSSSSSSSSVDSNADMSITIATMNISEIKAELLRRKIPIHDVFEKDELIRRLRQARQNDSQQEANTATKETSVKANTETIESKTSNHNHNHHKNNVGSTTTTTPLYFTTMDAGMRVPANGGNGGGIIVEPSSQPYATMKIQIPSSKRQHASSSSSSSPSEYHTLSLLVDTACTGFVLRPNIVQQYQLPSYETPVTMQGAAGISQTTGLTQLSTFTLFPATNNNNNAPPPKTFRSLPAAVQDIHGLPMVLDGIIGLSFINQFAAMEFDFRNGLIHFYKDRSAIPPLPTTDNHEMVVVDTKLNMIGSLGIYTVPVYIGGRGPVQMLVDTGASCTLLNWKGVADLGLSPSSSKQISRIAIPTGAMGSENVAIQLTHRLHVSSSFQMGDQLSSGIPISPETRMPIDIGQIPVIDNIPGVGGILGIDALMRCRTLRISTKHPATLTMMV